MRGIDYSEEDFQVALALYKAWEDAGIAEQLAVVQDAQPGNQEAEDAAYFYAFDVFEEMIRYAEDPQWPQRALMDLHSHILAAYGGRYAKRGNEHRAVRTALYDILENEAFVQIFDMEGWRAFEDADPVAPTLSDARTSRGTLILWDARVLTGYRRVAANFLMPLSRKDRWYETGSMEPVPMPGWENSRVPWEHYEIPMEHGRRRAWTGSYDAPMAFWLRLSHKMGCPAAVLVEGDREPGKLMEPQGAYVVWSANSVKPLVGQWSPNLRVALDFLLENGLV